MMVSHEAPFHGRRGAGWGGEGGGGYSVKEATGGFLGFGVD